MSGTENVRRRRNALAASVAAGVLLAGGGGVYLAATASGGTGAGDPVGAAATAPPPLRMEHGGTGPGGTGGGTGIAPGEPDPGGGPAGTVYTAEGPLPQGPSSAAVHRPEGLVTSAEVTRLAAALGVSGRPALVGDVWTIRPEKDGWGPRLDVGRRAPGNWTYSWFDGGPTGDACLEGPRCPPPGGAGPAPGRTPPGEAAARAAAAPVLKALGQDGAKVTADRTDGSVRRVNADPVVDGLPTYGWTTGLGIGRDGRPVSGSGTLKAPVKGDVYPVVGAAKALAALNEAAGAAGPAGVGHCPGVPPSGAGGAGDSGRADGGKANGGKVDGAGGIAPEPDCSTVAGTTPPKRVPVTGAVFGLAAEDVAGERVLVPSWLFTADPVDGSPHTVVGTAVAPEYLARSATPPPAPAGEGTAPVRQVQSYRAEDGGRKLTVTFWGGACGTYAVTAEERPERVAVRITEEAADPDRVCVMIAKQVTRTVTLHAPLGSRPVVDAASGETVPRH